MIKKISEYEIELINKNKEIKEIIIEIIKEINKFIQEEVYDLFQHNNKNPLDL